MRMSSNRSFLVLGSAAVIVVATAAIIGAALHGADAPLDDISSNFVQSEGAAPDSPPSPLDQAGTLRHARAPVVHDAGAPAF